MLEKFFAENPSVALGFSGGVDSSYLFYEGLRCGANIKAYYVKSAFQPEFELRDAYRLAQSLGAEITVLEADVLNSEQVTLNPSNRCYFCKREIFGSIKRQAAEDGFSVLIDGSNASDDEGERPGMKAINELSVRSPLRECAITKEEVRRLSKEAGLFTWNKPAYACLATRIPTGRKITKELLTSIEGAEDALFALGFSDFRVRVFGEAARLQFTQENIRNAVKHRKQVIEAVKPYFPAVLLDLEGR
ncbi:MAG: ATP-dependent sacrificial sulfur transferase LarE [Clostridiales bacterium]|jgi:uncharacterized protein|nr:ATP-dependent sacrificial sulfur transferase LarE [Clostridiales bacterium]